MMAAHVASAARSSMNVRRRRNAKYSIVASAVMPNRMAYAGTWIRYFHVWSAG